MKKYNFGISAFILFLSFFIFYKTKDFDKIVSKAPGAGFWPRILAIVLIILSVLLFIETLLKEKKASSDAPFEFKSKAMKRVYIMIGIFVIYALILYLGGFVIASLLFIPAVMYLLGERNKKKLLGASVIITGIVYFLFTILLHITLPQSVFL